MASNNNEGTELPDGISSLLLRAARLDHRHDRMLLIIFCLAIALAISSVANYFLYTRPIPPPRYFASTESGQLLEFLPLENPIRAGAQVTRYASDVIGCVKNLDAVHAETQLERCRDFFSPATFDALLADIAREGVIPALKQNGAIQDVEPAAPTIETQGVNEDGRYTYQVEVPVRIGITSGRNSKAYRDGVVTLRLTRVDTRLRSAGLVVTGYNEQIRTNNINTLSLPQ